MRTLLVSGIYKPEIGGPATFIPKLANQLLQQGNEVEVVTLKNSQANKTEEPWTVYYINRDQNIGLRFIKTAMRIFYRSITSEHVFANGLYQETGLSLFFLRKNSVAKIVGDPVWERATNLGETSLGIKDFNQANLKLKYKIQRNFLRWSLNRFTSITCPSVELVDLVKSWGVTIPITCIPNGVGSIIRRKNSQEFDLITVGRLVKWKNLDKLIIANAQLKTNLVIVGTGPEEENLRILANKINSNVTFTGLMDEEQVLGYLFRSKVFVLISSYEGLSFSLLQAMACGLPSIVSDVQGNMDVVKPEKESVLINLNQKNELVEAIISLLNNPEKRSILGENSLQRVEKSFSQKIQINKIIKQLMEGILP